MAGTQNPSGGGNGTSTTEGLDEGKRKKYGGHLVYSAELNYFAEMIYTGKLVGRINFRWTLRLFPFVYLVSAVSVAYLIDCTSSPSFSTIGWSFYGCLVVCLLLFAFRVNDFLKDLTSLNSVKNLYLEAKLSENKAVFYLDQAHKNLTLFFTFLSVVSAAVLAVSGKYFETLNSLISELSDASKEEAIIPLLLLVFSVSVFLLSMLGASTLKSFFLVKALKLIVANQP